MADTATRSALRAVGVPNPRAISATPSLSPADQSGGPRPVGP